VLVQLIGDNMENIEQIENPWIGVHINGWVMSQTENIMMGNAPRDYLEAHGCLPEDIDAVLLDELRKERDKKIAETDWWVLPDRTPTQDQLDYRQALRDITQTSTSIYDVVWPNKP
jgi:hypothetical protein